MTDFFADLEGELRAAAHRRAQGAPARRRPRFAARRLLAPLAFAGAAAVAVASALALSGGPDDPGDERPVAAPAPVPAVPAGLPDCAPAGQGLRAPAGLPLREVLEAVPALPREPVGGPLSEAATRALRDLGPKAAYVDTVVTLEAGHGVTASVVPVRDVPPPCAAVRPMFGEPFDGPGVCAIAVRGEELIGTLCHSVEVLEGYVLTSPRRLDGLTVVLGFAPRSEKAYGFESAGGGRALIRPRGGVVAVAVADSDRAELPEDEPVVRETREREERARNALPQQIPPPPGKAGKARPVPAPRADVAVLNGTTTPGLGALVAGRIGGAGPDLRIGQVTTAPDQTVERTRVLYSGGRSLAAARRVARSIGTRGVELSRTDQASLSRLAEAEIVVVVGKDARTR